ncbi:MAG: YeeE/YedE thiosulfate transporter family protein [Halanaerobiales bacterium]
MNGRLPFRKLNDFLLKKGLREPWSYKKGAILLAIINIIYFYLSGKIWSVSVNFTRWGSWFLSFLGINTTTWEVWNYHNGYFQPWKSRLTWINLGIILGAFISVSLASQFKWRKIKSKKQILLGLLGGYLMGYGARVAVGCNIGGLYSAISSLSLNGWLYLPFIILGIYLGSKYILRYFY